MIKNKIKGIFILGIFLASFLLAGCEPGTYPPFTPKEKVAKFHSGEEMLKAFEEARERNRGGLGRVVMEAVSGIASGQLLKSATFASIKETVSLGASREFSDTNIQVAGVDEADIIKTDGDYIYTLAQGKLIIVRAYPADQAEILSTTNIDNFNPLELFIHRDKLLVFGYSNSRNQPTLGEPTPEIYIPYRNFVSVKLYDLSDKENPELLRTVDLEGNYLTSRKIGENVYFVVNSYPRYYQDDVEPREIIPLYKDSKENGELNPIAEPTDIGYLEPIQAQNFITVASLSMTNEDKEIEKETIVGSGQNVYASLNNLYIAQTSWPRYDSLGELVEGFPEKTVVTKFRLSGGEVSFLGTGEVPGHILNQFSMDEHEDHFRIATTKGSFWGRAGQQSTNNVYVLNKDLILVGELEDLAPGESIYSVRFMGDRGYIVTFKKVDPLFVIDLDDPRNPSILGKLKIPGYSDYLHPYDENHIIGIGKDSIEAAEDLKTGRQLDFAWYQGVKMAIFDVSDVENPLELHKVVIGDRGTESPVLRDHKAFLFDRERNLLVLPITLAEIKGTRTSDNQHGEFTFQGAYVYELTLDGGFDLRGRVTHYDDDEVFKKSGYYFRGESSIKRSLYIEDVLYTLSDTRLQLNDLDDLERLKALEFKKREERSNLGRPVPEVIVIS